MNTSYMHKAANLLLVDNAGYECDDEATEIVGAATAKLTVAECAEFETWAATLGEGELATACMGSDITSEGGMGRAMEDEETGNVVVCPDVACKVLDTMFECL